MLPQSKHCDGGPSTDNPFVGVLQITWKRVEHTAVLLKCISLMLYNGMCVPWPMGCTMICTLHGPWVVQWYVYPMVHGVYNSLDSICTPWSMGCVRATLLPSTLFVDSVLPCKGYGMSVPKA